MEILALSAHFLWIIVSMKTPFASEQTTEGFRRASDQAEDPLTQLDGFRETGEAR